MGDDHEEAADVQFVHEDRRGGGPRFLQAEGGLEAAEEDLHIPPFAIQSLDVGG